MSRIEREKVFHDLRFGGSDSGRGPARKYYSVASEAQDFYKSSILRRCNGKAVLEYGCAKGDFSFELEAHGAVVSAIDISSEAITYAAAEARRRGSKVQFMEMNAERLSFPSNQFDMVVGSGILHHLDFRKACSEVLRVLRPGGTAVFLEPLVHNPLIALYRRCTPEMRSVDEHPLSMTDLRFLKDQSAEAEFRFFGLFVLVAVPFRHYRFFTSLRRTLSRIDALAFKAIPVVQRYAWMVVITVQRPPVVASST